MAVGNTIQDMKKFDTSDLTLDNIGVWPWPYKAITLIIVFAVVLVLVYFVKVKDMNASLQRLKSQEQTLKDQYSKKAFEAANLDELRQQMAELEKSFGALLKQLPLDTEVPGLLDDIDEVGRGSSIAMTNLDMEPERTAEFFVELPIRVIAEGGYHDFGAFVSGVAALPRIVTLHDFELNRQKDGGLLRMQIQAKTYRYKAEDE